jgi:DnaJ-class molecular chaperone
MAKSTTTKIDVEKVTPRVFAQKCPVCNGYGTLGFNGDKTQCHGCKGRGWIVLFNPE